MATVTKGSVEKLEEVLGEAARDLLEHKCQTIPKEQLHLPGGDFVDRIWKDSDRPTRVLRSFESLLDHGRLAGTGYLSILPVDQGIEHAAGASFAPNPIYFDGAKIVELAIEGGCNAVASTSFGLVLGLTGHAVGWPLPRGGSQTIANALAKVTGVDTSGKTLSAQIEAGNRETRTERTCLRSSSRTTDSGESR